MDFFVFEEKNVAAKDNTIITMYAIFPKPLSLIRMITFYDLFFSLPK